MKVVALVSGGLDSCTTVGRLAIEGHEVYPLFINYNQKMYEKEIFSAKKYLDELKKRMPNISDLKEAKIVLPFLKSSLVGTENVAKAIDPNFNTLESKKIDWVPARNIIFAVLAASYCETLGSRLISIGIYKEDEMPSYPDSSRDFLDSMELSLSKGMYGDKFKILSPFSDSFKWELVEYGSKNNLPLELTWSCYENGEKHCNQCRNCIDRRRAFEKANVKDLTNYA